MFQQYKSVIIWILFLVLVLLLVRDFQSLLKHSKLVLPEHHSGTQNTGFIQFKKEILPLFESRCSFLCHGLEQSKFEKIQKDPSKKGYFYFPLDSETGKIHRENGSVEDLYHLILGHSNQKEDKNHEGKIDFSAPARFSSILRYPLGTDQGGLPHKGVTVFSGVEDEDYQKLSSWVEGEIGLRSQSMNLDPKERIFSKKALPALVRNGCFLPSCHGPDAFNDLKLQLPMSGIDSEENLVSGFSNSMIRKIRKAFLGKKTRFVNFQGDLKLSRLLVKNLPIEKGGIHQRGGNQQFFESYQDLDVQKILEWLEFEKHALEAEIRKNTASISQESFGQVQGVMYIQGPLHQPTRFFAPDVFYPDTRLMLVKNPGGLPLENLNAKPLDLSKILGLTGAYIQSFDIGYDARSVVLSLKKAVNSPFRLFRFELDEDLLPIQESLRQISFGDQKKNEHLMNHIDPVFAPGPDLNRKYDLSHTRIIFASNQSGEVHPSSQYGVIGEADRGSNTFIEDNYRFERKGRYQGFNLYISSGDNQGESRLIARHEPLGDGKSGSRFVFKAPFPSAIKPGTKYYIQMKGVDWLPSYDLFSLDGDARTEPQRKKNFTRNLRQLTFSSSQERFPTLRSNGEFMFTSLRNLGFQSDLPVFNAAIYRVHSGGFDYHIQGGNRSRFPIHAHSREMPQGLEVRLLLSPENYWMAGTLAIIDHGLGVNIEAGNPIDQIYVQEGTESKYASSAPRYLPAQILLYPERGENSMTHTGVSPSGAFKDPYPLPDGSILVSASRKSLNHQDPEADPNFDLHIIRFANSPHQRLPGKPGKFDLLPLRSLNSQEFSETHPRPIMLRQKEKAILTQHFAKGVETIERNGVHQAVKETMAEVHCLDYPLLQSFLNHFEPVGKRKILELSQGNLNTTGSNKDDQKLHSVRILKNLPVKSQSGSLNDPQFPFRNSFSLGLHVPREIVAEVPLQSDGSFFAKVPANVPLVIQGLNQQKMAVHSMNRWFYTQPGEKLSFSIPRSVFPVRCSGCHGSLTGKPVDGLGPPDLVTSASDVLANYDFATGSKKEPVNELGRNPLNISFQKDIQPIITRKCVSCHSGRNSAGGFDLTPGMRGEFSIAYKSFMSLEYGENQEKQGRLGEKMALSYSSHLMELFMGVELNSVYPIAQPGIPHPKENPLNEDELLSFIRWIDTGAIYDYKSGEVSR